MIPSPLENTSEDPNVLRTTEKVVAGALMVGDVVELRDFNWNTYWEPIERIVRSKSGNTLYLTGSRSAGRRYREVRATTMVDRVVSSDPRRVSLHQLEQEGRAWSVRIATPSYDPDLPERDVSGGSFNGSDDVRGVLIRVTDPRDLRGLASVLMQAAGQIEATAGTK